MAKKKNKNILDFCRSSQRLFTAALVLMILVAIILLIESKNSYSTLASLVPFFPMPFVLLGLSAVVGLFTCRQMLEYAKDNNHGMALKKSNTTHRCQVVSVVVLFIIFTSVSFMLLFYIAAYSLRDMVTGESLYRSLLESGVDRTTAYQYVEQARSFVEQRAVSSIVETVISLAVCIVFIVCYMKILISSDVARKSFLDTKDDSKKATKKKKEEEGSKKSSQKLSQRPSQKLEYSDDSDEDDL